MLDTAHRYFLEVIRTGSVKDAAVQLRVAASAISRQIAKLEESCGSPLFERRPHGMVPTQAGELMTRYARRTAMDAQRLQQEMGSLHRSALRSTIRIGSSEAVALNLLTPAMTSFRGAHPDTAFQVQVNTPAGVAQRLSDGTIDIGLSFSLRPPNGEVTARHEVPAPLRAVMAPSHPLAKHARVSLVDLRPFPIALTETGTTARLLFDSVAEASNSEPFDVAYSSSSSSVVFAIVKSGQAVTISGDIALGDALRRRELVAIPLAEAEAEARVLRVQTAKDRLLPALVEEFLAALIASLPTPHCSVPGRAQAPGRKR